MFDRVLNTPLWHSVYNSVYEGTSSTKTTGWENSLIIKVLEIHIKSTKKIGGRGVGGRPSHIYFLHPLARKTEALFFNR